MAKHGEVDAKFVVEAFRVALEVPGGSTAKQVLQRATDLAFEVAGLRKEVDDLREERASLRKQMLDELWRDDARKKIEELLTELEAAKAARDFAQQAQINACYNRDKVVEEANGLKAELAEARRELAAAQAARQYYVPPPIPPLIAITNGGEDTSP